MNKDILNNILGSQRKAKVFARVVKPLGGGRYQVRDESGRMMDVDSSDTWSPEDGVTVDKDGRIVGKSSKFVVKKKYQV